MSNCLGVYWCWMHGRPGDKEYMRALQPPAVRILDPDVQHLIDVHQLAPNALLLPRDHPLSEQHSDVEHYPVGTGIRHAQDWRGKIDNWRAQAASRGATLPGDDQWVVVGENEPHVWSYLESSVRYTFTFLNECSRLGLRACALNLSVGWPANKGEGTPPDWEPYEPVHEALVGTNHFLTLHEYWYKSGPQDGWGWWAGRHHSCPWPDVKIIIGECGVDNYVDKGRWEAEGGNRGWRGNISPAQYRDQMGEYIVKCDTRIACVLPFLTDYASNMWESFDTQEAHPYLLDLSDRKPITPAPGSEPIPPEPGPTPPTPTDVQTGSVTAPAGLNVRSGPGTEFEKIGALAYASTVLTDGNVFGWLHLADGWVSGEYVGEPEAGVQIDGQGLPPVVVLSPATEQANWQRSIGFVLQHEGGYQNNPNDIGNWTGCEKGEGENKGTNYGISACSYPQLDIANLSEQEAVAIYQRDYWGPSGASALPWPMCLMVMDTSVLHGVGTARNWLNEVGPNPYEFAAKRLRVYTGSASWLNFGKAWVNRVSDVLVEMAT